MGFFSDSEQDKINREKAGIFNGGSPSASNMAGMSWQARQEVLRLQREEQARREAAAKKKSGW